MILTASLLWAGVIPAVIPQAVPAANKEGNATKFQLFTGADPATSDCAKFDASHNLVGAGAACGGTGGYTLNVWGTTYSIIDAETDYIGFASATPTTTAAHRKMYIPVAGTIIIAELFFACNTAGTNENWSAYIRLNDTTDTLIQTVGVSATSRTWTNSALSIAVVAGDFIEIKIINPTWATNPSGAPSWGGYVYVQQ